MSLFSCLVSSGFTDRVPLRDPSLRSTNKEVVKLLVGNKIDRESEREVSERAAIRPPRSLAPDVALRAQVKKEEGAAFARQNNMLFIEARCVCVRVVCCFTHHL